MKGTNSSSLALYGKREGNEKGERRQLIALSMCLLWEGERESATID